MGMISRDWGCLNPRCRTAFHSFEEAPTCPSCGNVRVHWVPGGGHMLSGNTRRADQTLRGLAEKYGFTNLNSPSPSRLNRAAPKADHPGQERYVGQHTFAPGFTANIYSKASCEPSLTRNTVKGTTVAVGDLASPLAPSRTIGGPSLNHKILARYKP